MATEDVNIELVSACLLNHVLTSMAKSGDVNWYPFDTYTGQLSFYAFTGQSEGLCSDPLPILPAIFGSLQGFAVKSEVDPMAINGVDYSYVNVKFTARRTAVSIGFATLLFIGRLA